MRVPLPLRAPCSSVQVRKVDRLAHTKTAVSRMEGFGKMFFLGTGTSAAGPHP
jgi:hypothetical protein